MSFANLKRNRGQIDRLSAAATATQTTTKSYVDERMWKPTVDKQNNGYAVIRFLPDGKEGSEVHFVRYWDHAFKGPTGKWYIEKSLTSIEQQDPVGEYNSKLWNSGIESDKETARRQKRRLHHVSNILVVSDPGNPENEGKVFMYQYGKKIFDKLMDAWSPEFADETPMNPFCMWEGADFKLKIRDVEGYRNYDKSEFSSTRVLSESDERLEEVYDKCYDLSEFTDPANYKSYAELETKMRNVLGQTEPQPTMAQTASLGVDKAPALDDNIPDYAAPKKTEVDGEDNTMDYFASLVNED
jgi:hypothetical protein